MPEPLIVGSVEQLVAALASSESREIRITCNLEKVPPLRLTPRQCLCGVGDTPVVLAFAPGTDGLELTKDNRVSRLRLLAEPRCCAIHLARDHDNVGHMLLENIETEGRVSMIAARGRGSGHIEIRSLDIKAADARQETPQPVGYGVSVLQGAFTFWNQQSSDAGTITADLLNISVGRFNAPVLGSGIFVCGADHDNFSLRAQRLHTGAVYSNGGLATGTADRISGGVFVVYGARVDTVENDGPTVTFGVNDMALDNWGTVGRWIARDKVTTFGESAIGFVNFGQLGQLRVRAPIETHGTGARGFNVYSGTVRQATFDRIETRGNGAIGIQISQPIGELIVFHGVETHGGRGNSLVKGVIQELDATGLSIRPGGFAEEIRIRGGLLTNDETAPALEQAGHIGRFSIRGGFGWRAHLPSTQVKPN